MTRTRIAYLAHDLGDAAVHRRVAMLRLGGAEVSVAGLVRGSRPVADVAGVPALTLGTSSDARLGQRAVRIGQLSVFGMGRLARHVGEVDVVVARNLEMLALAVRLTRRLPRRPRLVYECLDIHRLLTAPGALGAGLRGIERRLGASVDLVLTSSPAFVANHLGQGPFADRILLVENKVLLTPDTPEPAAPTPAGPPWRIGWFGALRCRRSFQLLSALAARAAGQVEVVVRGKPSPAIFPDLAAEAAGQRHLSYAGPYGARDLGAIYGDVHFAWCIDFYEEGQNSAWLLPNRLYEGGYHNTVPIALEAVETGRLLARRGFGLGLGSDHAGGLDALFARMTPQRYTDEVARLGAQPRSLWQADARDCVRLVEALAGVRSDSGQAA